MEESHRRRNPLTREPGNFPETVMSRGTYKSVGQAEKFGRKLQSVPLVILGEKGGFHSAA